MRVSKRRRRDRAYLHLTCLVRHGTTPPRLKAAADWVNTLHQEAYVMYRVQSHVIKEMGPLILVIILIRGVELAWSSSIWVKHVLRKSHVAVTSSLLDFAYIMEPKRKCQNPGRNLVAMGLYLSATSSAPHYTDKHMYSADATEGPRGGSGRPLATPKYPLPNRMRSRAYFHYA